MSSKAGNMVRSLVKAFEILDCFKKHEELGIKEISEMMQLSKSTVYGLIRTLSAHQYLEQNPRDRKYRLGIKLFELGTLMRQRIDLGKEIKPFALELSEKYASTVHVAAIYANSIVYIDKFDAPDAAVTYSQMGKPAPCYAAGVGKAIAAFLTEPRQDEILSRTVIEKYTDHTRICAQAIKREWEVTKKRGYALDDEEIEIGLRCVAAPVFDGNKVPVAAISVSSPSGRLKDSMMEMVAQDVMNAARQVSHRLGSEF